jgi:hypothetical protein
MLTGVEFCGAAKMALLPTVTPPFTDRLPPLMSNTEPEPNEIDDNTLTAPGPGMTHAEPAGTVIEL